MPLGPEDHGTEGAVIVSSLDAPHVPPWSGCERTEDIEDLVESLEGQAASPWNVRRRHRDQTRVGVPIDDGPSAVGDETFEQGQQQTGTRDHSRCDRETAP